MHDPVRRWHSPFDLDELLLLFQHRWRRIAFGAVLGVALGVGAAEFLAPRFTSEAKLLYEPADVPAQYVRSTVTERGPEQSQVLRERFTSDATLHAVVERVGARKLDPGGDSSDRAVAAGIREGLGFGVLEASHYRGGAQVIELSYSAPDPEVAASVLEALIDEFTTNEASLRTQQARSTEAFLASEVARSAERLAALESNLLSARAGLPRQLWYRSEGAIQETGSDANAIVLAGLIEELARAESIYTEEHPNVQTLRDQVAAARRQMPPKVRRLATIHSQQLEEYEGLFREHFRARERHDQLAEKLLEASIAGNLEVERAGSRFRQLRTPTRPRTPDFPDPLLLGAAGGVVGLGLVVGALLAGTWLRPRFRNLFALEELAGVPIIASIPRLIPRKLRSRSIEGVDRRLIAATAPEAAASEQYRAFLPLYLSHKQPRVVLVTSSMRADGKTLTTANLAITTAAELGGDVLLIDADLHRPAVHRLFGRERKPGLSDVLQKRATLRQCIQPSGIPGLSLLPAGALRQTRVARFADEEFTRVLDEARSEFSTIFIDTPPLLPVVDTQLLRNAADMVILVVRANATPRDAVERALDALGEVSAVVFNDIDASSYRRTYHADPYERYGDED